MRRRRLPPGPRWSMFLLLLLLGLLLELFLLPHVQQCVSLGHLSQDHPHCPGVDTPSVGLTFQKFWGGVEKGPPHLAPGNDQLTAAAAAASIMTAGAADALAAAAASVVASAHVATAGDVAAAGNISRSSSGSRNRGRKDRGRLSKVAHLCSPFAVKENV